MKKHNYAYLEQAWVMGSSFVLLIFAIYVKKERTVTSLIQSKPWANRQISVSHEQHVIH